MAIVSGMHCGCDEGGHDHSSTDTVTAPASVPADATYAVRGVVKLLPARAGGMLTIQHEAIPTFTNIEGKQVGMMAMTMPFAVAADVSLEGLRPNDKIAFTYEIRFHGEPRNLVTRIAKLPTNTELKLGR